MNGLLFWNPGEYKLNFHFAPPLLSRTDPVTGEPRKRRFGPWMRPLLKLLARMKRMRGTRFDPFSYSAERRLDRALIGEYEATLAKNGVECRMDPKWYDKPADADTKSTVV